jgi:hypothetical protein
MFDSGNRYTRACFPGTRERLFISIAQWISNADNPVCWLSGLAGAGKSTIAQSVSSLCVEQDLLAATFFFSRTIDDCRSTTKLFPTIAYQLAKYIPALRPLIHNAFDEDPFIPSKAARYQFESLIVKPFQSLKGHDFPRKVVVIDAIDECDDKQSAEFVIRLLADAVVRYHLPLQFFFTSRPERHIENAFKGIHTMTCTFRLQDFDAQDDIRLFLDARFEEIYEAHSDVMCLIPKPWPLADDVTSILSMCSGLFIVASCALKFIDDECDLPNYRLQIILSDRAQYSSVYGDLDALYRQILDIPPSSLEDSICLVLGTIIFLAQPLPLAALEHLCSTRLPAGHVRLTLRWLRSILVIPDEEGKPVQIFHESLRDFVTDKRRSSDHFLDPRVHNASITRLCLDLILTSQNSTENDEAEPSTRTWMDSTNGALTYACHQWPFHLSHSMRHDDLINAIDKLDISTWLVALLEFGGLHYINSSLDSVIQWLEVNFRAICTLSAFHIIQYIILSRSSQILSP